MVRSVMCSHNNGVILSSSGLDTSFSHNQSVRRGIHSCDPACRTDFLQSQVWVQIDKLIVNGLLLEFWYPKSRKVCWGFHQSFAARPTKWYDIYVIIMMGWAGACYSRGIKMCSLLECQITLCIWLTFDSVFVWMLERLCISQLNKFLFSRSQKLPFMNVYVFTLAQF